MKRIGLLLIVLMLGTLAFAGPKAETPASGTTGGTLRFAWWGNPTRDERTLAVVELFKQKNPGVTVETETTGFANYWENIGAQAAAGTLPDVMQMDYAYIAQYNSRNLLVDMQPLAQRGLIDLSKWSDAGLSGGRLGGKLVGLNLGVNAWGLEVDRGVLTRAGVTIDDSTWTWREFEQAALQIFQRTQVQTMGYGFDAWYQIQENAVRYFGVPYYSADGKSMGFTNNAAAIAALKDIYEVFNRLRAAGALYDPAESFVAGVAMAEGPFVKGKTWNNWNWSNQHVAYAAAAARPLDYYVCPAPTAGMKAPYGTYLKPSMLISILSTSKNQDLAAKFVNFFINDIDANRILLGERGVPIPTNVMDDLGPRVAPEMKYTFDFITKATKVSSAIDPPDPARTAETRDVMTPIVRQAVSGQITADAAVTQQIQAANAVLSRP